ncbi:hypothetical protein KP509_33G059700 [Ceratopteris richardii]|nr:hypothetical protein KP509_33G059700 [Ceratopteris richardii]
MRCYTTSSGAVSASEHHTMVLTATTSAASPASSLCSSSAASSSSSCTSSLSISCSSFPADRHIRRHLSLRPVCHDIRASSFLSPNASPFHISRRSFEPVKCDIGGQYEETFADVEKHLLDYFTFKAARTVLLQLYEMNPPQYSWFYRFVADNRPQDSERFLRTLVKERQQLGERVMVTRLHLYNL